MRELYCYDADLRVLRVDWDSVDPPEVMFPAGVLADRPTEDLPPETREAVATLGA